MQRKSVKVLSMLLCLMLFVAMFSGCTAGEENKDTNNAETTAASEDNETQTTETEEDKPELRMLTTNSKTDLNEDPVAKVLEKLTGYKVQIDMLPAEKPEDKLNILIASGEQYDFVTIPGTSKYSLIFNNFAKNGALLDITNLIDQYGENIKEVISEKSFNYTTLDGKVFGIPSSKTSIKKPAIGTGLVIRTDWLKKVGMDAPKTVEELVAVLKAFKEQDPGGNGDNNIPLTAIGSKPYIYINGISGAFGIASPYMEINGELVSYANNPGFKEYLSFMIELYKEGLLDNEFATNKSATAVEKFTSGKAGMLEVDWWRIPSLLPAIQKNVPDASFEYIEPISGINGKGYGGNIGGLDRIIFIPKAAQNPEHAIKYINLKLQEDIFKAFTIGEEGIHHEVKDGEYYPILPKFFDERDKASQFLTGIDEEKYPIYWKARVRKNEDMYKAWKFLNEETVDSAVGNIAYGAPYLKGYTDKAAALDQIIADYTVQAIVAGNLDGYNAFLKSWKDAGGEESMEALNDWYKTIK